ncbi:MAG: hypothetical protein MJ252_09585 [archaeon]|nr:hypothetical protein [archaeon]
METIESNHHVYTESSVSQFNTPFLRLKSLLPKKHSFNDTSNKKHSFADTSQKSFYSTVYSLIPMKTIKINTSSNFDYDSKKDTIEDKEEEKEDKKLTKKRKFILEEVNKIEKELLKDDEIKRKEEEERKKKMEIRHIKKRPVNTKLFYPPLYIGYYYSEGEKYNKQFKSIDIQNRILGEKQRLNIINTRDFYNKNVKKTKHLQYFKSSFPTYTEERNKGYVKNLENELKSEKNFNFSLYNYRKDIPPKEPKWYLKELGIKTNNQFPTIKLNTYDIKKPNKSHEGINNLKKGTFKLEYKKKIRKKSNASISEDSSETSSVNE